MAALDGAQGTPQKLIALESRWSDRPCFHCEREFTDSERPWLWMGTFALIMHQPCLLDWLPRVLQDAARIIAGESK